MNRIYRIGTVRFFRTHFVHSVSSVCKTKKAMRGKNPPSPRLRRGSNERIDIFEGVARLIKFCELRGQGAHGSDQPPVRLGLLASFGGITRIRFKGSPAPSFADELFRPFLCGQQNWSWTLSHPAPPQSFTRSYGSKSRSQRVKELSVIRYWLFVRRSQPPRPPLHLTLPSFVSFVISVVKFYFAAVSCFTFVWKIAIQAPFSCFQTEPAL